MPQIWSDQKESSMNHVEAMRILKALVEGHDPVSNRPLPADSVLQNASVMRALLLGREAIEAGVDRKKRRALLPPNVGIAWTEEEDQKLRAAWNEKQSVDQIAASHGRTNRAIESRLERLGLMTADERKTSFTFGERGSSSGGGGESEGVTRRRRGRPPRGADDGSSTIGAAD